MRVTSSTRSHPDFYPRSPCGERPPRVIREPTATGFLSTLSLRRATHESADDMYQHQFLSTLSLRRATKITLTKSVGDSISIHALLAESDNLKKYKSFGMLQFLSTLSLRRATIHHRQRRQLPSHFYPRSPCGERHNTKNNYTDYCDFYPRSPCGERRQVKQTCRAEISISIHALLAESDERANRFAHAPPQFLSTLSLRRATHHLSTYRHQGQHFYPRSPCGERRWLRCWQLAACDISIHALLAESDNQQPTGTTRTTYFYPRSPCGERHRRYQWMQF